MSSRPFFFASGLLLERFMGPVAKLMHNRCMTVVEFVSDRCYCSLRNSFRVFTG